MVATCGGRPGHSLPELIVATTFLATTLVAVGGTALLGARWTTRAVSVQTAVRAAEAVLDSLAADPGAGPGEAETGVLRLRWTITSGVVRVEAGRAGETTYLVTLEAAKLPSVPVLPDVGAEVVP